MPTIRKLSESDKDYQPLYDRLLHSFPGHELAEDIIANYWKKYIVQDTSRYLLELFLRTQGKTDNLAASIEDLEGFMEDTSDLLIAIYVIHSIDENNLI